jgi:hypothetical protein
VLLVTVPAPVPASVTVNANVDTLNVAVTLSAALIVTTQLPVPVQAPLHPAKVLPLFGVSLNVTCDPLVKFAVQMLGHVIPAGELDTVPVPVPASATVNAKLVVELNVAVTLSAAVIVIVQVPVPLHAAFPLQPAKTVPVLAEAVSVTCWPLLKFAEQVLGQEMPTGLLVTVPAVPVPASVTVNANVDGLNVAVTPSAALIVTTQLPVPLHPAPLQPPNVLPVFGDSFSVTIVPLAKFAVHVLGQTIPAGVLVTVPLPVPASVTVRAKVVPGLNVAVTVKVPFVVEVTVHGAVPKQP